MFEWASVAKGAFLDLSKMRLAIDTFKRSETINNLIEDNIHKMQKTGLKEWTYNDSLHFYDRENSYDFDLSFAVGKAKYSMHIEEYKFRQFVDRFKVVEGDMEYCHTILAHLSKDGHYFIHAE